MSEIESLTSKRKIELPKALREIVKMLAEEAPLTYEELAERLQKDLSTIVRQCQRLEELEVVEKTTKDLKTAVKLKEDVEVDEEGNVYVPSLIEEPVDRLRRILYEAGVKGKKLNFILALVESNPRSLEDPNELYDVLVAVGIRRLLAQQIVKAFFGTEFSPQAPPPAPRYPPYPYPQYPQYPPYPQYPYIPYPRESSRLEVLIERLVDEIKEMKSSRPQPYPTMRRIKVDEQGKPVEIVEEPVLGKSNKEEFWKLLFEIRERDNQVIQQIVRETKEMVNTIVQKLTDQLREIDAKRIDEVSKLREEVWKRDAEYQRRLYERDVSDLKASIESIKRYYEEKMEELLQDLKKEWEYKLKIMELEQSKGLRDVFISEIRETAKELREATKDIRESLTDYMKQALRMPRPQQQLPQVSEEEKKKILEALRKKAGETREEEKEETTKVELKVVRE